MALLKEKYPANFSGADVSIFGISGTDDAVKPKEQIFSAFFLSNWARLRSFSSALPPQRGDLFPPVTRMDGIFDGGGSQGSAKLAFTVAKGNVLADVWIAFVVGRTTLYVPFEGEYRCTGNECTLKATSTEAVPSLSPTPYFRSGDNLLLHGKPGAGLEGTLQAEGREVFKDQSQEVKYNLKFSKP